MNAFRFPLQKALDWRRTQLELEEARYKQQAAALAALDRARAEVEASGIRAEVEVRAWGSIDGSDLGALNRFRLRVKCEESQIAGQRVVEAAKVAERQEAMMEARRRCRLLERLRERRLSEWESARDKELDEVASESFLARWGRNAD